MGIHLAQVTDFAMWLGLSRDETMIGTKKIRIVAACVLVPVLLAMVTVPTAGCVRFLHYGSSYTPVLIGDGDGGAIVAFSKSKKGDLLDFHVQRLSPDGERLWGGSGTLLGNGYRTHSGL